MNTEFPSENGQSSEQISSLGSRLRHARESHGFTVTDVARRLRLTNERIECLENDDYQNMPGATFVKGYLSSYARLVNLVPDELIADFKRLNLMPETEPFILPPHKSSSVALGQKSVRRVIYVGVIGLFILIAIWWSSLTNNESGGLNLDASAKHQPTNNVAPALSATAANIAASANTAASTNVINNTQNNSQGNPQSGPDQNGPDKVQSLKNASQETEPNRLAAPETNASGASVPEDQKKSATASSEPSSANAARDSVEANSASATKHDAKIAGDDTDEPVKAHKKRIRRSQPEIDETFDE